MSSTDKLIKAVSVINPWIAAIGSGAAIGASTSEDKQKGALKGALIGLGTLASGKLSDKMIEAIIQKKFGNKVKIAEEFVRLKQAGDRTELLKFVKKHQLSPKVLEHLSNVMPKAIAMRQIGKPLANAAGLAGVAYALKNDSNSKKK